MLGNQISLTNNVAKQVISVTATQNQTDFTVQGGYRINQLGVYRNGVRLVDGRDFLARNGSSVTLVSQGANAGDAMEFVVFDDFRVADALSVNSGGTVNAAVNIKGSADQPTLTFNGSGILKVGDTSVELAIGRENANPFGSYLQARASNGAARDILLNPVGGDVGIGTDDPQQKLNVYNVAPNDRGGILVQNVDYADDQDRPYLTVGTHNWTGANTNWDTHGFEHRIKSDGAGVPRVTVDGENGELFSITNAGNIGIGITNPTTKLEVATSVDGEATLATFKNTSTGGTNETVDINLGLEGTSTSSNVILRAGKESNHGSGAATDNFFAVHTTLDNTSSEKLRVTSTGNVHIDSGAILRWGSSDSATIIGNEGTGATGYLAFSPNSEAIRVLANGRTGIGTTNPIDKVHIEGAGQATTSPSDSGTRGCYLRLSDTGSSANNGGGLLFSNIQADNAGSLGMAAIKGLLQDGNNNTRGHIGFFVRTGTSDTTLTEEMRVTEHGLTFNGDNASGNALSDYEEGTYTPTITLGSGTINTNHDDALSYVKVGRLVHVQGRIHLTLSANDVTSFSFTLPFTNCTALAEQSEDTSAVIHVIRATNAGGNVDGIRHFRFTANSATVEMQDPDGGPTGDFGVNNPHISVNLQYRSV